MVTTTDNTELSEPVKKAPIASEATWKSTTKVLVAAGIVGLVFLLDNVSGEDSLLGEKSTVQLYYLEICTIVACILIPIFFLQFASGRKSSAASKGEKGAPEKEPQQSWACPKRFCQTKEALPKQTEDQRSAKRIAIEAESAEMWLANTGDVASTCKWLKDLQKSNIAVDEVVSNTVQDACARAINTEYVQQAMNQISCQGAKAMVNDYENLAKPFSRLGNWQEVEKITQAMQDQGVAMDAYYLYTLLMSYSSAQAKEPERAKAAYIKAVKDGVEVNKHVVTALARSIGREQANLVAKAATQ